MVISKRYAIRLVIVFGLMLAALVIFWSIIHEVIREKEDAIDTGVINFIQQYSNPQLTGLMKAMTFLGSSTFLLPAYVLLVGWFFFYQRKRIVALSVMLIGTIGFCLVALLKNIFHRGRRLDPLITPLHSYSFPSGHTTSGFIFYGLLIYLVWQSKWRPVYKYILGILLFLVAIMIGISRIYLGMHYPSDVIAGFCLGFVWLTIALLLMHWMSRPKKKELVM